MGDVVSAYEWFIKVMTIYIVYHYQTLWHTDCTYCIPMPWSIIKHGCNYAADDRNVGTLGVPGGTNLNN